MYQKQLILEHEILHKQLLKVLLLYRTDRWYLGDFIRHVSWLTSLTAVQPHILALATHKEYLTLFETDSRVHKLLDESTLTDTDLAVYDLVVIPSSFLPVEFSHIIKRALYYSDRGWIYCRYGVVVASGEKQSINYFTNALHEYGQTALPTAHTISLQFPEDDIVTMGHAVTNIFHNDNPVLIYNPTASSPFTRQTTIKKEVENILNIEEHAALISNVRVLMPNYNILIGSAFRSGDTLNQQIITRLKSTLANDPAIKTILDLEYPDCTNLRGFSMLLKCEPVKAVLGTSTGTTTHLASLVGLSSFSVERATDSQMIANWREPDSFQMGSFRWRNPSSLVGAYNLDWSTKSLADFATIGQGFYYHMLIQQGMCKTLFVVGDATIRLLARAFLSQIEKHEPYGLISTALNLIAVIIPEAQQFYSDFSDELSYLRLRPGLETITDLGSLMNQVEIVLRPHAVLVSDILKDSLLYKLAAQYAAAPAAVEADTSFEVLAKVRVGAPLLDADLTRLGMRSETEFYNWLLSKLAPESAELCRRLEGSIVRDGWQHQVFIQDNIVVKTILTNPASEYLTDSYSLESITAALLAAGSLVPACSQLYMNRFAASRIKMFIEPGSDDTSDYYGRVPIKKVALATGWVDEQLDIYIGFMQHALFNFDIKFRDLGLDPYGILKDVDFSVAKSVTTDAFYDFNLNRRTDIFHMGINELIINGQFLSQFLNGEELLGHYTARLQTTIGIDIRHHLIGWQWGDHDNQAITPFAYKLRDFIKSQAVTAVPRPVVPLLNEVMEQHAYKLLHRLLIS